MKCRHCGSEHFAPFLDLGTAPPSNSYLHEADLAKPELWYPLVIRVCHECLLVQTEDFAGRETFFSDSYAYFSAFSDSWLKHAERYVDGMVRRFGLSRASRVVEVAANDGYLLQYVKARGIPCLGVEPTASTAAAARGRGIDIVAEFFGASLAESLAADDWSADLMAANNVLAHVPDINDFAKGFATLLKPDGVATFEFPHILNMMAECQFDTAYHEHFSYLSLLAVKRIFESNGLKIFDVETTPWHGGSLRVFACRSASAAHALSDSVNTVIDLERSAGLENPGAYAAMQDGALRIRDSLLEYLIDARRSGLKVVAYGAAAKGNTLLNFAGVKSDLIQAVADRNPAKQGLYMPGSRIAIVDEQALRALRPERVLILPWNLKDEIMRQLSYIGDWGGKFVTTVPMLQVHEI
jgi:hypothetical protein